MTTAIERAEELLRSLTGVPADGVWSAPGRVNLIGEHTDYNDGFVLPFAIPQRTAAAARLRGDGIIRVASTLAPAPVEVALDDLDRLSSADAGAEAEADADAKVEVETDAARDAAGRSTGRPAVPEWAAYPLGVAWAMRATGVRGTGVDIAFASDVPVGAGLSSSAAIEGAAASALNALWGGGLDPVALAAVGRRAENEAVGAPTGIMDQMASMLGEPGTALFLDCRSIASEHVPFELAGAGLAVLVIDTRVKHSHATGGYGERRAECERGAALMGVAALRDLSVADLAAAQRSMDDTTFRRVRHIVTENQRVIDTVALLRADGVRAIGGLLTASHASMRDDFEISVPELDTAVDAALAAGALGARMTGGGFGGSAIALIDTDLVGAVSDAIQRAFAAAGFAEPAMFTVRPAGGPVRDR
ncbi:Galactokinase [Leucobacter sp. BZR 635]